MVLPRMVTFAIAVVLAIAEGVQQALHLGGYAHSAISCIIIMSGVLGIKPATPTQIQKELPAHVATIAAALIAAVNVIQQAIPTMPTWVHVVIGVLLVIGSTMGVQVSNFAVSGAATKELARTQRPARAGVPGHPPANHPLPPT